MARVVRSRASMMRRGGSRLRAARPRQRPRARPPRRQPSRREARRGDSRLQGRGHLEGRAAEKRRRVLSPTA